MLPCHHKLFTLLILAACLLTACMALDPGQHADFRSDISHTNSEDARLLAYVQRLELNPEDTDALLQIGTIHEKRGNLDLAQKAYSMALRQQPELTEIQERLGLVLLRLRKWDEARQHLSLVSEKKQARWQTLNAMGLLEDRDSRHKNAQSYFKSALLLAPGNPIILNNLGYSFYLDGKLGEALASLEGAIAASPQMEQAWLNRGLVQAHQGLYDLALESFRHVLEPADAHNNLGYILMSMGREEMAREQLERAIDLSPEYHRLANENLMNLRSSTH